MFLIVIGVIALIFGFVNANIYSPTQRYSNIIKLIGVALIFIGVAISSVVQIGPGEVGVQKLFGKVNTNTLESGLNVVNPLVEVVNFDIKTQNYTMSAKHDEGDVAGDDAIRVLSADGLEVVIDLTVLYKVIPNDAPRILQQIGTDYRNTIVRPICRTKIRDNAVY
jgi:regulator of protease activity HflC (stomatin/prohibitin superfamily)